MDQEKAFVTMPMRHGCHTFSSVLEANAEDVKVVQELLRHSTAKMMLDPYTSTQVLDPNADYRWPGNA